MPDNDFWLEKWQKSEIGFHQEDINPYLKKYLDRFETKGQVFVPLCGKSKDMLFIASAGHKVCGVELSALAISDFFSENQLSFKNDKVGKFKRWSHSDFQILEGDLFNLKTTDLDFDYIFDRASYVALDPMQRKNFAEILKKSSKSGTKLLLLSFEYPQSQYDGPPFSISKNEIIRNFSPDFSLELLETNSDGPVSKRFTEQGLDFFYEHVYLLEKQ